MPSADGAPWPWELPEDPQLRAFPKAWAGLSKLQQELAVLGGWTGSEPGLWVFRNGQAMLVPS